MLCRLRFFWKLKKLKKLKELKELKPSALLFVIN